MYFEQSLPVAKRHLEMGFPPASQQCAAYIPRVPKEKIVRYAICLQKSMRLCCTHEFEENQESTTTLPIFRRRRLTWRLTRWDVWEGPRWRSVDRCEKQPFVQVQLIKAEDGGPINSKFKLIARKQTNFLVRCSYTYKNIIRDGESTALYAIRCWHCWHCSEQKVWM